MPSIITTTTQRRNGITKFTNCRVLRGDALVWDDVWVSSVTGKVVQSQKAFFDDLILPDETIDLGGRILAPGLIECQLNGAFGFNFSTVLEDMSEYGKRLSDLNQRLIQTGVTSYVPTVTSQTSDLYHKVLPYLRPSGGSRRPDDGAESLGAHVEGPFISPTKNGIHNVAVLRQAHSIKDLEDMYGAENINPEAAAAAQGTSSSTGVALPVKVLTAAPELGSIIELVPELRRRGIIYSVGHTEATYEQASAAVAAGATMITHLFNAMRPLHHRNPGVFGVLGKAESQPRPYFGVISDGIHLHPTTIKIAYNAHPDGFILVTDAMHIVGLPDGRYEWTNGNDQQFMIKKGPVVTGENSSTIAGSSIVLIDCVSNFLNWSGTSLPKALKAVTSTPAAMLGLQGVKGALDAGADADLVVLSEDKGPSGTRLAVDEVWKFGTRVFDKGGEAGRAGRVIEANHEKHHGNFGSDGGSSPERSLLVS
ncbi:N-acetylglucosamine-6-phosphate deacetylase [Pleurostoma richardsiae]|uniref:N-acetylglucosamine-6-phosphate deacetylase n=1 Tax=Pleurostoma richardsiae TaxID=41990 RepID=A0AA38RLV6_9PEZI|nr:N-acetylglucosamine-6-phosphate deacetylase [Pleurostoma richardsiae]